MPRITSSHVLVVLLALAGCAPEEDTINVAKAQKSPTPTASSDRVESGTSGLPTVRYVAVTPASLTLNAPDADGNTPAGFAATATVSAMAVLSNGQPDPKGIAWSVTDQRLRLEADGTLRVLPGASAGSAVLLAISVTDPGKTASLPVTITTNGQLRLTFTPQLPLLSKDVYRVTVTHGESLVLKQNFKGNTRLTLQAQDYQVLAEHVTPDGTVAASSSASVTIAPNGLSTQDFSLE
ncbi:MAG TPA: hypothetical protein V6D05_03140 [Stenomitos sp.]